ncbi:MAG: 2-amino-4-hydroxy-6-hydroxymethyldihydropteridine pyrophosphokinae [Paenibacillus sp.]|jgi:2-amino-4-hydroxy-6-hydroxymethyldihydropteridine diphosphokinase|nr:2-amino-4-hydroxy-6-hydroxymethyldihydropteridine pyrophosphokinae [Paenibacillus sp.]
MAASYEHNPERRQPDQAPSVNSSAETFDSPRIPEAIASSEQARSPVEAYIALGSNMGDREAHLMRAIAELDAQPGIVVTKVSGIYETDPVGYTDQPAFLNMAVAIRTSLGPLELLRTQLRLESLLGRIRQVRWGPRTIDLDLLLYDNVRMDLEELTLPHPRMMERAFVLVPLHDVISSSHPLHEQVSATSAHALQAGKDGITLWKTINWRSASEPSGS